jgi:hypothetical protein
MADLTALDAAHKALDETLSTAYVNQGWSPDLVTTLSISVLVFTAVVLVLATLLLWRKDYGGQMILKAFGLITIIGMSAFLMVVGYSNEQLTPIIGLFGALAGYLLGKDTNAGR